MTTPALTEIAGIKARLAAHAARQCALLDELFTETRALMDLHDTVAALHNRLAADAAAKLITEANEAFPG